MSVIRLEGVSRTYKSSGGVKTPALADIDLEVEEGDFVSIVGSSGSGKSTLMNVIGLLDRDFEGTYDLSGVNINKLSDNKLSELRSEEIGFVFQQFHLLRRATVLENVLLPTAYRKLPDAQTRALDLIDRIGLAEHVDHKSNQLSGGQMQRVAIARALITRPKLILADEPTGNLDVATAAEIMAIFRELHSAGSTILLITHEDEIARHAGRIVRLRDGRLDTGSGATNTDGTVAA